MLIRVLRGHLPTVAARPDPQHPRMKPRCFSTVGKAIPRERHVFARYGTRRLSDVDVDFEPFSSASEWATVFEALSETGPNRLSAAGVSSEQLRASPNTPTKRELDGIFPA